MIRDQIRAPVLAALMAFGASASPAIAQTHGEAHAVLLQGADATFRFGGFGAGGALVVNWFGLDADFGLLVDNSDEGGVAPMYAGGASVRLLADGRVSPFFGGGYAGFGDTSGPFVGGGLNIWFARSAAFRVEVRSYVPASDNRPCRDSPRPPVCDAATNATFLRAGMTFRFGR